MMKPGGCAALSTPFHAAWMTMFWPIIMGMILKSMEGLTRTVQRIHMDDSI
jgi:hypothetical protein